MDTKKPVGEIEYGYGDRQLFFDTEKYIQAFKEALDQFGVSGGFKATTITFDPQTRKAIDDLIYGAFDEENPYDLEHYQKKYASAAGKAQMQEADPIESELGDEELEL